MQVARLTGFSTPVFGVSWNPSESERAIARRILIKLEDRRVLYNYMEMESPKNCVKSIIEIRQMLSEELGKLDGALSLSESLRAMRASCRNFLDSVQATEKERTNEWRKFYGIFLAQLGIFRGVMGIHIAHIATQYGLDIEANLETILPIIDEGYET